MSMRNVSWWLNKKYKIISWEKDKIKSGEKKDF